MLTSCWNACMYQSFEVQRNTYIPSHPTPASSWWSQLCVKIGLLGHSNNWLALEVQATSSRKMGPVPTPKKALLYGVPPDHRKLKLKLKASHPSATNITTCTHFQCMHIPVVCKPHWHQHCPSCHHTLFPTGHWCTPPLYPHTDWSLPPDEHFHKCSFHCHLL